MAQLAGKFAGIVEVSVDAAQAEALRHAGPSQGAESHGRIGRSQKSAPAGRRLKLALVGHDRIGIVREVSQVLATMRSTSKAWTPTPPARRCRPPCCSMPWPN
jgi:glycine cleavage system regulatory protein